MARRPGEHPKTIQTRLGHFSIKVTMDRYGWVAQIVCRCLRVTVYDSARSAAPPLGYACRIAKKGRRRPRGGVGLRSWLPAGVLLVGMLAVSGTAAAVDPPDLTDLPVNLEFTDGDCSAYPRSYSQSFTLSFVPEPESIVPLIWVMVQNASGQVVQSEPWVPGSGPIVLRSDTDAYFEEFRINPATGAWDYLFIDGEGLECTWGVVNTNQAELDDRIGQMLAFFSEISTTTIAPPTTAAPVTTAPPSTEPPEPLPTTAPVATAPPVDFDTQSGGLPGAWIVAGVGIVSAGLAAVFIFGAYFLAGGKPPGADYYSRLRELRHQRRMQQKREAEEAEEQRRFAAYMDEHGDEPVDTYTVDTFPYTEDFEDTEEDDDRPHFPSILPVGADESDEVPHFPDPLPDREPSKPDCVQLRIECERLRAEATQLRLDAGEAAFQAEQLVAECASAGHRVTDLEEKIADLTAREGAPQRYERLAEAQIDLRSARAQYESKCEAAEAAREAAESAETQARAAESAAEEACRRAEECEAEAD